MMDECRDTEPRRIPRISVIVPVFHVEQHLRQCLDSILGQTFEDFELILVNDGGNDSEAAICEEYAHADSRIVYVEQPNGGTAAARNTGLDLAQGEWVMFVDSDDWVRERFCEAALKGVEDTEAKMGIFDLAGTWEDSAEEYIDTSSLPEGIHDAHDVLIARLQGNVNCYAWNKIYHRSLWSGMRFPVGECWEDDAIIHELINEAHSIAIIHEILYCKRAREASITAVASSTGEDRKWLYMQRKRRYLYIKDACPDLLPYTEGNTAKAALFYGLYCLSVESDDEEFENARAWVRDERLSLAGANPKQRMAFFCFQHCKPLCRAIALLDARRRYGR